MSNKLAVATFIGVVIVSPALAGDVPACNDPVILKTLHDGIFKAGIDKAIELEQRGLNDIDALKNEWQHNADAIESRLQSPKPLVETQQKLSPNVVQWLEKSDRKQALEMLKGIRGRLAGIPADIQKINVQILELEHVDAIIEYIRQQS